MADQTLRLACTSIANQLFGATGSDDDGAKTTNDSASRSKTRAQQRLQAVASRVSDAAMSLHRLCCSRANGEPIAIIATAAGKGASPMEEAAYCVCVVVRAAYPALWVALTRRAVVLRPRHPVLRLGAPTPLPIPLKEMERFAGRSQRVVEKFVRPVLASSTATLASSSRPSSPPPAPSSSGVGTWETLSALQAEQLAVCYYWAVTSPAERVKHTKQGVLFEAAVPVAPSSSSPPRADASAGTLRRAQADIAGAESDGAEGDDSRGGYRRDRLWHAQAQPLVPQRLPQDGPPGSSTEARHAHRAAVHLAPPTLPSFDDDDGADDGGRRRTGAHTTTTTTTMPTAASSALSAAAAHGGEASTRSHAAVAGGSLRAALKRFHEPSSMSTAATMRTTTTNTNNSDRTKDSAVSSSRAFPIAPFSQVLAAQARLYNDDLDGLSRAPAGAECAHHTERHPPKRRTEQGDGSRGVTDTGSPDQDAEATEETSAARQKGPTAAARTDDGARLRTRLLDMFDAAEEVTTPALNEEPASEPDTGVTDAPDKTAEVPVEHPRDLAWQAARRLSDVLTSTSSLLPGGGGGFSSSGVEELCAKLELVKSHLHWQRLECCVADPLWFSQRRYVLPTAPDTLGVSSLLSATTRPSAAAAPTATAAAHMAHLHTHLGSSYDHRTPLPRTPPAASTAAVPSPGSATSPLAAYTQAHFLSPGRTRFGIGLDTAGPLLSARPASLVTAPLLWTRLVLCAAWLRSYATVYLPAVLAARAHAGAREEVGGVRRLWFDPSAEAVQAQQAVAAFCLDVVVDAYARFHGGRAPPPPPPPPLLCLAPPLPPPLSASQRASAGATGRQTRASAPPQSLRGSQGGGDTDRAMGVSTSSVPRVATRPAVCPVCDALTRHTPPIVCGALREDRTVLQQRLRAHHLPPRGSDPYCLTPCLASGVDLLQGLARAWRSWAEAATEKTTTATATTTTRHQKDSVVDAEEDATTRMTSTTTTTKTTDTPVNDHLRALHLRALARRLHALVESLVGLQRLGKLAVRASSAAEAAAPHQHNSGARSSSPTHAAPQTHERLSHQHTNTTNMVVETDGHTRRPKQRCCPDLLPLSALDPTCRTATVSSSGAGRHAHRGSTEAGGAVSSSTTSPAMLVLALYDAYGWATHTLFEPLLGSVPALMTTTASNSSSSTKKAPSHLATGAGLATTATPSLAALTDMLVAVVPITTNDNDDDDDDDDDAPPPAALSHWERCALVWHAGDVRSVQASTTTTTESAPTVASSPPSPPLFDDPDGIVRRELQASQAQLLSYLDFFPSIPLVLEEDGVLECGRCFNLFHQACVCPSQRDVHNSEFLCHACRILEATP